MSAPSLLSLPGSHWIFNPSVAVPAVGAAVLYLLAVGHAAGRWPVRRTSAFLAGIGAVVLALQSGIDSYDDRMLSDHMVQHLLLLLVAPPLLLGGRPVILALRSLPPTRRAAFARGLDWSRRFTGPVQSLVLFTAAVLLTHLPSFYDATLRHALLHDAEHALYLTVGVLMWSPLLDGDPLPRHRLSGIGKLVYLVVAMMPMALIGAYLNRDSGLFYPAYGPSAHALGISALNDQAQAGAIMWVVGGCIMVAVGLSAAVAAMVAEERRQVARESRAVPLVRPDGRPLA